MSASEYGCIGQPLLDAELVHDLEALRPQQLRDKYKPEATPQAYTCGDKASEQYGRVLVQVRDNTVRERAKTVAA